MGKKAVTVTADPPLHTAEPFGTFRARWYERLVWAASDWSPLPASMRQRLRRRFARSVTGPFDVAEEGMNLRLYPAENYCDRVLFARRTLPEAAEHHALVPLLKPGMTFVDIGANVGSYSCFVGTRCGGDVTILAFEPHPRTFQKLLFNLAANQLPTGDVRNCGVGPQAMELDLWSDGGSNIGHTSMLKEGTANAAVSVRVPVVRLDEALANAGVAAIDLLKIDIEGFEDRALAPFFDAADPALYPAHILIEIAHAHLWERDLMVMLQERGYWEIFVTPENRLLSLTR